MESIRTLFVTGVILAALIGVSPEAAGQARRAKQEKSQPWTSEPLPLIWESSYTKTPPKIDGKPDDLWQTAKPVTVVVREAIGGDHPTQVVLRAVHTDDTFYLIAHWPDDTKSDMRDPYVWNDEKKEYDRPSKPDDQFALEFPMAGNFDISMLTLVNEYTADVWHWKAGRGNPIGWWMINDILSAKSKSRMEKNIQWGGMGRYMSLASPMKVSLATT